jgi:hypothetical protein
MNLLPISIGQAGNQINNELTNLLQSQDYLSDYKNTCNSFAKTFLIDTEKKVIDKNFITGKNKNSFVDGVNVITTNSGRGNNWALGYSLDYEEYSKFGNSPKLFNYSDNYTSTRNICKNGFEKINKFLEKCDFMKGFMFIHSLNGGTGSGVGSRIIEMLKDEYPKFNFVDCPIQGFNSTFIMIIFFFS